MYYRKNKKEFIDYLKTLRPEDWEKKTTSEWTVKDVVAHMIGWEKHDPSIIQQTWQSKQDPWWQEKSDYDEFNKKEVEYYKHYSPQVLIEELEKWQAEVEKTISEIGEENLKKYPDLFGWLFDTSDKNHYEHHLRQIKEVLR
jgi:hypothetical protein